MPGIEKRKVLSDLIRRQLFDRRIRYYELADALGVHYNTLNRWIRSGLTDERYTRIRQAIRELEGGGAP